MARIREAQGDLAGALDLLDEAERQYMGDFFPNVRPVAAVKTRVWLRQGRVGDALSWAREQGISANDELSYLREFEHITLARTLLARHGKDHADPSLEEAIDLLNRLLQAAEDGKRMGSVIEILILLALAHQAHDDLPAALIVIHRALILAEPEGYVRMFVDEGPPMAALLRAAVTRAIVPAYACELLAALRTQESTVAVPSHIPSLPALQLVSEPLSQRELDVLRLFNSDLSGPEIARELVVALSTVRTHTKSIYGKLGVTSRLAAVKRAGELGMI